MACVIAAPASGSGKTLLSLVLASWARQKKINLQTFKVGPDYLDPQQLTAVSNNPCRNLDLILCGENWVKQTFFFHSKPTSMVLVEGVMGLFDGIGSTEKGSTAELAKLLKLPVVLVIDARGQACSIAPLVKGFRDHDPSLKIAGVVLNQVNTKRHKDLLIESLSRIEIKVLGCLPHAPQLQIDSRHLGLIPAHEISDLTKRIHNWAEIAEANLDLETFTKLLKPNTSVIKYKNKKTLNLPKRTSQFYPIAIAEDKAFHFRYPETKEYLEELEMPIITWKPTENEPIPSEAKGLIIPGGFPEQYAEQLSNCSQSIQTLQSFFGRHPIYAECGGMLLLGQYLIDMNGNRYPMAGLLPFQAQRGNLKIGYRNLKCTNNNLITRKGDVLVGHEFHYWELRDCDSSLEYKENKRMNHAKESIKSIWKVNGSQNEDFEEGWGNQLLHASWIHLHWPSSPQIINMWQKKIKMQD